MILIQIGNSNPDSPGPNIKAKRNFPFTRGQLMANILTVLGAVALFAIVYKISALVAKLFFTQPTDVFSPADKD